MRSTPGGSSQRAETVMMPEDTRPSLQLTFDRAPRFVLLLLSIIMELMLAPLLVVALTLRILFFSYATGLIMWRTLRRPDVTIDTIAGAACVYTLLAVVWGNMYVLLEFLRPGSFSIAAPWLMGASRDPGAALVYFSFITLTTVGYGD